MGIWNLKGVIFSAIIGCWIVGACGCSSTNPNWVELAENICQMSVCAESELEELPQQINQFHVLPPIEVYKSKTKGTTKLKLFIDTKGVVQCIQLIESSGNKEWDVNASKAAKRLKFSPGKKSGKRVWSSVEKSISFDSTGIKDHR